jgi:Na+/proline symporter
MTFATTTAVGGLSFLDYLIIAIYLLAMLGMGLWIARKQQSTDDFFVGGRNLPPWAVGISLFASLLSTITFLGMPGEMFRTGVAFLTRQLALPLVLAVVWFLWIPFFMRLNLTSAYEYLERRFNYTVRALAAVFCLLLLFGWISVVVLTASRAMAEIADINLNWFFGYNTPATQLHADGSARIGAEDFLQDGTTLASHIRAATTTGRVTPGKRVWDMLAATEQDRWPNPEAGNPLSDESKQFVAESLSALLKQRDLYDQSAWQSVRLHGAAKTYLKAGIDNLSDVDVSHLNRSLLVSAFPDQIGQRRPAFRDADMHVIILCIGMFSVLYTTLGGIRAVVWTDVIQFFILMAGAFFTMGFIAWMTNSGLGEWLETSKAHKHEAVEWFTPDIGDRSSVAFISLGMFFWFICTHGSNQVALQRYFTVKDVRSARTSYLVSAVASVGIGVILAGVGISLMHFITKYDLPSSSGITSVVDSVRNTAQDGLFPEFIRIYLPSGMRGMVVAALFAAAMSTIDSGANSASTIITVDFVRRFDPTAGTDRELRRARMLTAAMGVIVVVYTIGLYHLSKGTDIISLCQKGFNCFLGPLGALFVLGMFSKRVTARSVVPAFLLGEVFGVASSYSKDLFDFNFSTHLVIAGSWLVTIVTAHTLAILFQTKATDEQQQFLWLPVVRNSEPTQ